MELIYQNEYNLHYGDRLGHYMIEYLLIEFYNLATEMVAIMDSEINTKQEKFSDNSAQHNSKHI